MSVTEVRGDAEAARRGMWTNREVTGMKTVPRRLLLLGRGPVGVEMAQAVHRLGGEVARSTALGTCSFTRPGRCGEASPRSCARRHRAFPRRHGRRRSPRGHEYILNLDDGNKLSGDRLLLATGRRSRIEYLGPETVGVEVNGHGVPVDSRDSRTERLWAVGDSTGLAAGECWREMSRPRPRRVLGLARLWKEPW